MSGEGMLSLKGWCSAWHTRHRFCRFCWAEQQKELPKELLQGEQSWGMVFAVPNIAPWTANWKGRGVYAKFSSNYAMIFLLQAQDCAGFLLILFFPCTFWVRTFYVSVLLWSHQFYNYYSEMIVDHSKLLSQTHTLQSFHSLSCCFITPPVGLVMVPAVLFCHQGQLGQALTCLVLTEYTE